jgi:hypothetical protein
LRGDNQNQRNGGSNNGNSMRDDERNERERKASSEMYSRINNPDKYNSSDNVIRVRKESVDLKTQDF